MLLLSSILALLCISAARADCPAALKTLLNANLESNQVNGCGSDWQYSARPSGGWCYKVFLGSLSQADSAAQCVAQGAVLSGLQDTTELAFIQAATLAQMTQASGSVWLGLKRTAACSKIGKTAACTNTTAFAWTDGSATGTAGFVFQDGQPDNVSASKDQDCALLLVANTTTITAGATYYSGQLDDVQCAPTFAAYNQGRVTRAFVCGKKASK
ncbi:unnamed protein product [Caenorhabditis sp. 36 PRJEB53466]|nr:unnamed protein product [Caenorhabditis sp. 36 PRJEB53466]